MHLYVSAYYQNMYIYVYYASEYYHLQRYIIVDVYVVHICYIK